MGGSDIWTVGERLLCRGVSNKEMGEGEISIYVCLSSGISEFRRRDVRY